MLSFRIGNPLGIKPHINLNPCDEKLQLTDNDACDIGKHVTGLISVSTFSVTSQVVESTEKISKVQESVKMFKTGQFWKMSIARYKKVDLSQHFFVLWWFEHISRSVSLSLSKKPPQSKMFSKSFAVPPILYCGNKHQLYNDNCTNILIFVKTNTRQRQRQQHHPKVGFRIFFENTLLETISLENKLSENKIFENTCLKNERKTIWSVTNREVLHELPEERLRKGWAAIRV